MLGEPGLGTLELPRRVGSFDEPVEAHERCAPVSLECRGQFLFGLLVQADPDEGEVIRIEYRHIVAEALRHLFPLSDNGITVGRIRQVFDMNTSGPFVERLALDAPLLLEAWQNLRQVGPVVEPVIQATQQCQRVTVIPGVFLDAA